MSGLYPDGLTGREPEIAGYDAADVTIDSECDECHYQGDVEAREYTICAGRDETDVEYQWECPQCGEENTEEHTVSNVDPDALWELSC